MNWQMVIGLEVHVQLLTVSKLFSTAPTSFGQAANHCADLVDLGYPGTLPTINQQAVEHAIKFGCYVGATINRQSVFERKQYFYPDLPKGYQLSQYQSPIVIGGFIPAPTIEDADYQVPLTRAHLEEDAGKSIHAHGKTLIDLNRAGTPLLEVVTEPCIYSVEAAVSYLKHLHQIVQYLAICDGNLEQGSFRCDINVSLRTSPDAPLGTRTEIKNLNSFRFVEQAIHAEVQRQVDCLTQNTPVVQATMLFDEKQQRTIPMRTKEQANDYRYFPCPDLLPVTITDASIAAIEKNMPESLTAKAHRYQQTYQLSADTISILLQRPKLCHFFESTLPLSPITAKTMANWLVRDVLAIMSQQQRDLPPFSSAQFAELMTLLHEKSIHQAQAKTVLQALCESDDRPSSIIDKLGIAQASDNDHISTLIDKVLADHSQQVQQFLAGKGKILGFLVGQVMKHSKGQADPTEVNRLLREKLKVTASW